jgi:glycosyltransferase involved in cell wall biosynthesis
MTNNISFIVPVFRDTRYLERTIKSIQDQTLNCWEIVIVNDSDNDDADQGIADVVVKYDRITVIRTHDVGLSKARNIGIRSNDSTLFVPLDPDDYIHPRYIEQTLPAIAHNPNLGFVYVNSIYTDGENFQSVPSADYSFFNLVQNNFIVYCSLFNRKAFDDVGGYDEENFNYFEDYQFFINLGAKGWYGFHQTQELFYYTVRKDSAYQSEHTQKMGSVYKSFIVTRRPEVFPLVWQEQAKETMSKFPKDFMLWNRQKQEEWVRENIT